MREQEAANFLSVTPRTIRNYRRRGLLPYQEIKGKTCPVIDYNQSDLERLKSKLSQRGQTSPVGKKRPLPRVTYGLPPEEFLELTTQAKKYNSTTSDHARRLMREAMESRLRAEIADLRSQNEKNAGEVKRLRREVASAVEVVLELVGLSPAEAKEWVLQNLR